jgi:probable O-glycosylation ligase (exosortase A-associated)
MPIRDIFLTLTIFGLLPVCFKRPWIGLLVWAWLGYMNPHKLCWGFARGMPFAQIVALVVLTGILMDRDNLRRQIPMFRETLMMAGLWIIFTFTTVFSFYPDEAWPHLGKVSKILLFTFVPLLYFQDRERLRMLFMVLALSLGFYGLKGGIWVFRTGALGTSAVLGPEGTFIGGNTEIGLALNMTLPFLLILAREEPRRWLRKLMLTAFGFSIIAIIFTYSRGAILGLPIVLMMLFMRARHRIWGILAMVVLGFFIMHFPPEEWFNRLETISEYEEDRSASMRLESWTVAWRFALDNPLTGGGFWVLAHDAIFSRYLDNYIRAQSAHSIYFTVLGDHGFPGLFLFVGLIVSCFLTLGAMRRRAARHPNGSWLVNYCEMIQASLMAYAVSGAFISQSYWDLFYHLVSFVILLKAIAIKEGIFAVPVRTEQVQYWGRPADASAPAPAGSRAT